MTTPMPDLSTPRPWNFDPIKPHKMRSYAPQWGSVGSKSIAYIRPGVGSMTTEVWAANKALIVQAVNSYEDLVAALEAWRSMFAPDSLPPEMETTMKAYWQTCAALAKAKEARP